MMVIMNPDGCNWSIGRSSTTLLLLVLCFGFFPDVFSLTLTDIQLQDREVLVSLLVGAKYGMSQVINHKLNVISTLVEFSSISRVELLSESDKVSLLRVSLHDMKV